MFCKVFGMLLLKLSPPSLCAYETESFFNRNYTNSLLIWMDLIQNGMSWSPKETEEGPIDDHFLESHWRL